MQNVHEFKPKSRPNDKLDYDEIAAHLVFLRDIAPLIANKSEAFDITNVEKHHPNWGYCQWVVQQLLPPALGVSEHVYHCGFLRRPDGVEYNLVIGGGDMVLSLTKKELPQELLEDKGCYDLLVPMNIHNSPDSPWVKEGDYEVLDDKPLFALTSSRIKSDPTPLHHYVLNEILHGFFIFGTIANNGVCYRKTTGYHEYAFTLSGDEGKGEFLMCRMIVSDTSYTMTKS